MEVRQPSALLSERSSPQLCHRPEAALLTGLQGGGAADCCWGGCTGSGTAVLC